jgi:hypothetical protein
VKGRLYVKGAWVLLVTALVGWPTTHVLMLMTSPAGFTSWTAHVLLAISWLAIIYTALDIIVTANVKRDQEDGDS